jgi:hypothetical protein
LIIIIYKAHLYEDVENNLYVRLVFNEFQNSSEPVAGTLEPEWNTGSFSLPFFFLYFIRYDR